MFRSGEFYRGGVRETLPARPSSDTPGGQSTLSPRQSPVDSTAIRLGRATPRAASDVSGSFHETARKSDAVIFPGQESIPRSHAATKLAYIASPIAWLFSGWNWQAVRLSRQTTAANGSG